MKDIEPNKNDTHLITINTPFYLLLRCFLFLYVCVSVYVCMCRCASVYGSVVRCALECRFLQMPEEGTISARTEMGYNLL